MGFVIPRKVTEKLVPEPSGDNVDIRQRVGGRFAVMRFSGRIKDDSFTKAERKLRDWMNDKGLIGDGDAEFAGYDPPWTPGPFRRNEILIRLKCEDQLAVSRQRTAACYSDIEFGHTPPQ